MITKRFAFSQFRGGARRKGALALCLVLCGLGLSVSASDKHATIITFDAAGAGTGAFQGTLGIAINPAGVIAGQYYDATNVAHGILRAPDGTITTFDAPGAVDTFVESINPAGAIAGIYLDASDVFHGYLRARDGTITTFDAPGGGTGAYQGTVTASVDGLNPEGAIAGGTIDNNGAFHGYVRAPDGTITEFDVPGAGTGSGQGTDPVGINPAGAIPGSYVDASGVNHGFLRTKHGAITTFDVPGAGAGGGQGTIPFCNNPAGAITGYYIDASSVSHGFLRTRQRCREDDKDSRENCDEEETAR